MINAVCFVLYAAGFLAVLTPLARRGAASPVRRAVLARGERKLTGSEQLVNRVGAALHRYISLDNIKKERMSRDLKLLGEADTPEAFYSKAAATGLIYSSIAALLIPFSPLLSVGAAVGIFIALYTSETAKITKRIAEKRRLIERELPQFAGTITQNLRTTRDIITILEGYRKVCGSALQREIDITLTDIKTGSTEKALCSLDTRLGSVKVSELVRGLIGVYRGDNQEIYFEMLAKDYLKSESEAMKKELMTRPEKLKPNIVLLLLCMMLMFMVSIGGYMFGQFGTMF